MITLVSLLFITVIPIDCKITNFSLYLLDIYVADDYGNQNEQHTTSSLQTRVQQETLIINNVQSLIVVLLAG